METGENHQTHNDKSNRPTACIMSVVYCAAVSLLLGFETDEKQKQKQKRREEKHTHTQRKKQTDEI